jgi:predicted dehydrogenase
VASAVGAMEGNSDKKMSKFIIIGAGWRTEFFLRIVAALPERFAVSAVVTRRPERAAELTNLFGVNCVATLEDALATNVKPDFAVTSVPWGVNPELLVSLHKLHMPTLSETPPAPDVAGMTDLWEALGPKARVQIAEQYPFQPELAARIAVAHSGKIGTPSHAQVSTAHGYHGMAVMRRLLGVGIGEVTVQGKRFSGPIIKSRGRVDISDIPETEEIVASGQTIGWLHFAEGKKSGVFDFSGDQYFSWIRKNRVLVRGERGEIDSSSCRWLVDQKTPLDAPFLRREAGHGGNLEGFALSGITLGEQWAWKNPFFPARLADDELAIATCLMHMESYAGGGEGYYSLAEGLHDHHLGITLDQAAASGQSITLPPMPWWE